MGLEEFFASLKAFCTARNKFNDVEQQTSKCVDCKIRNFCYSPPDSIEDNQPLHEVIEIIQSS